MTSDWSPFGSHADDTFCGYSGPLIWSDQVAEDGLPVWERHEGRCATAQSERLSDVTTPTAARGPYPARPEED